MQETIKSLDESLDYCVKTFPYFMWVPGLRTTKEIWSLYGVTHIDTKSSSNAKSGSIMLSINIQHIEKIGYFVSAHLDRVCLCESSHIGLSSFEEAIAPIEEFMQTLSKLVTVIND